MGGWGEKGELRSCLELGWVAHLWGQAPGSGAICQTGVQKPGSQLQLCTWHTTCCWHIPFFLGFRTGVLFAAPIAVLSLPSKPFSQLAELIHKEVADHFFFFLFWTSHRLWSPQARDPIWAAVVTYATAVTMLKPLPHFTSQGIEPVFWCCRDAADPVAPQWELQRLTFMEHLQCAEQVEEHRGLHRLSDLPKVILLVRARVGICIQASWRHGLWS